jgi:large conductance mechanosensitive channel
LPKRWRRPRSPSCSAARTDRIDQTSPRRRPARGVDSVEAAHTPRPRPHLRRTIHVKGFKDFILRGNLVELAVAFIMATAFAALVTATVALLLDIVGKIFGEPDFSSWTPMDIGVGIWLTAVLSFVTMAAVVYFVIVVPYVKAREMMNRRKEIEDEPAAVSEDITLLTEIRDLLAQRSNPI